MAILASLANKKGPLAVPFPFAILILLLAFTTLLKLQSTLDSSLARKGWDVSTKKEQIKKWDDAATRFIEIATKGTVQESLVILGRKLRRVENEKSRNEIWGKTLKKAVRPIMLSNGISEFIVSRRTFVRLDRILTIPDNEAGQKIYDKLVGFFGGLLIESLIEKQKIVIPASTKIVFSVNNNVYENLPEKIRTSIADAIGNEPRITCGPIPKRAKEGRTRRKKRKSE